MYVDIVRRTHMLENIREIENSSWVDFFDKLVLVIQIGIGFKIKTLIIVKNTHVQCWTLQKRAIRIITFSKPDEHSEPLFKELEILKLTDLVTLHNALLIYHYYYNLLPSSFENFFQTVASVHSYNTRLASKSTYYINTIKTNYGKFNIRFAAVKVWNHLEESIKHLPLKTFKNKVKLNLLQSYCSWVFNWYLLI